MLRVCLDKLFLANLFLLLFMGLLHFLVLFMEPTILFQLTFTFTYSIFSKKISVLAK